ncbi:helix-turn-helix domain-containing protein [Myxococcus sp. K15C18031901]|uniref:helix-turn-helix domain-containing protein n=1 Tax=Myxococcus dinghuensis TaxID=2906761 RepID=UPI0020A7C89C|nr:helix-turn-helix domain-containing protein [Myxococcus dinghuensis]MCP3101022.1 helix-turn-helix domain-containing protein [Myxococcus dinghuensis]
MRVTTFAPGPRLAPFVRAFEVVEARELVTRVLVPEPSIIVGFRFGGTSQMLEDARTLPVPDHVITGLRVDARRMRTLAGGAIILAKFHAAGAARFFEEPLHELLGETLALETLVPHADVDRVASRIAEAEDDARRVAVFEAFLLSRLRPEPVSGAVLAAVRAVHEEPSAVRIAALAREVGLSQDALEKGFRRAVGASPKRLASILRMRQAVSAYRPGMSFSRLAHASGYYDQPHFNRELRAVVGEAPSRFFGSGTYC